MAGLGLTCLQIKVNVSGLFTERSKKHSEYQLILPVDLILFLVAVGLRPLFPC